jgi:transcriptional regulator with XRE-family HTH domain
MNKLTEIAGRQFAAARALVGLTPDELARSANISLSALTRIETDLATTSDLHDLTAVRTALESAGVEFLIGGDEGPGVRLRQPRPEPDSIETSELNASNDE